MNIYIIDTSSLIELKNRYPQEIFPTIWEKMNNLYKEKRLISPIEVKKEINEGDDQLKKWIKDKLDMFIKPDKNQTIIVNEIIKNYSFLAKYQKIGPNADPWIIALAIEKINIENFELYHNNYIIITEESKFKDNRIPAVAKKYNIRCISIIELFKEEGWKF